MFDDPRNPQSIEGLGKGVAAILLILGSFQYMYAISWIIKEYYYILLAVTNARNKE